MKLAATLCDLRHILVHGMFTREVIMVVFEVLVLNVGLFVSGSAKLELPLYNRTFNLIVFCHPKLWFSSSLYQTLACHSCFSFANRVRKFG